MKRIIRRLLPLVLMVTLLTLASCLSNNHMYRHNRSHCDCPTF